MVELLSYLTFIAWDASVHAFSFSLLPVISSCFLVFYVAPLGRFVVFTVTSYLIGCVLHLASSFASQYYDYVSSRVQSHSPTDGLLGSGVCPILIPEALTPVEINEGYYRTHKKHKKMIQDNITTALFKNFWIGAGKKCAGMKTWL